ncbi:hypothetical protein GOBAR_AA14641 [Gossypium barbadense]|uniref:Ubiquitin-like domain-containing protein n=7 Tax=Gossypium TaxID=3633 RepID=A0A2P5XRR4_GOSBA|nr:hypothetical protein GOBAR_AA14641 [Gossypium barbadense]
MPEEDLVDIKFRIYDGSDIGPFRYSATSTVDMLKQRIVSDWPKGKTIVPKSVNEVKLISSGKILENNKTVGLCKVPFGEVPGGAIIMHVVVQPSLAKAKTEPKTFFFLSSSPSLQSLPPEHSFHHFGLLAVLDWDRAIQNGNRMRVGDLGNLGLVMVIKCSK